MNIPTRLRYVHLFPLRFSHPPTPSMIRNIHNRPWGILKKKKKYRNVDFSWVLVPSQTFSSSYPSTASIPSKTVNEGMGLSDDLLVSLSMNHNNSAETHSELIDNLKKNGFLKNSRAENAMRKVDRKEFSGKTSTPYEDKPHPIGFSATITSAHMHAISLDLLADSLTEGHRVLDIGCGSGYLTICMGLMVGDKGRVVGIDHYPELVKCSIKNTSITHSHLLEWRGRTIVSYHVRNGFDGAPEFGTYDCIHVGAAVKTVPKSLIAQLRPSGRLLIPVLKPNHPGEQDLLLIQKDSKGKLITPYTPIMSVVYSSMQIKPSITEDYQTSSLTELEGKKKNTCITAEKLARTFQTK